MLAAGRKMRIGLGRVAHFEGSVDDWNEMVRRNGRGRRSQRGNRAGIVALDAQFLLHDRNDVDNGSGAGEETDHENGPG